MQPLQVHETLLTYNSYSEAATTSLYLEACSSKMITISETRLHSPVCDPQFALVHPALMSFLSCCHQGLAFLVKRAILLYRWLCRRHALV